MFCKKKGCSLVAQDLASSPSSAPGNEATQDYAALSQQSSPRTLTNSISVPLVSLVQDRFEKTSWGPPTAAMKVFHIPPS